MKVSPVKLCFTISSLLILGACQENEIERPPPRASQDNTQSATQDSDDNSTTDTRRDTNTEDATSDVNENTEDAATLFIRDELADKNWSHCYDDIGESIESVYTFTEQGNLTVSFRAYFADDCNGVADIEESLAHTYKIEATSVEGVWYLDAVESDSGDEEFYAIKLEDDGLYISHPETSRVELDLTFEQGFFDIFMDIN